MTDREHLQKIVEAYGELTNIAQVAIDTFGLIDDKARWDALKAAIEAAREEAQGG